VAADVETRWQELQARYADRAAVSYFYQVAERPLYTINGAHLISQGLGACGARNVFEDLPTLAPQINPEAVLQANPKVLFAGRIDAGATSLNHWRSWPRLHAVRDEALFYLPADLINRATPRLLDAVEIACRLLEDYRSGRVTEVAGS
jgi:iron complex transport system substrate-binding protein